MSFHCQMVVIQFDPIYRYTYILIYIRTSIPQLLLVPNNLKPEIIARQEVIEAAKEERLCNDPLQSVVMAYKIGDNHMEVS